MTREEEVRKAIQTLLDEGIRGNAGGLAMVPKAALQLLLEDYTELETTIAMCSEKMCLHCMTVDHTTEHHDRLADGAK